MQRDTESLNLGRLESIGRFGHVWTLGHIEGSFVKILMSKSLQVGLG